MYIEDEFKEERSDEIQRIIREFPLASIVANTENGLVAEHIPVLLRENTHLFGHVSLSNSLFTQQIIDRQVMCIFKGKNSYISANYYPSKFEDHKKVPTWNYQVVHVYGEIQFYNDEKTKLAILGRLTKHHENLVNGDRAWKMSDAPKDYLKEMLNHLVAFEIEITKVIAKSKLSQNREQRDFEQVIKELKLRDHHKLADSMKDLNR